MGTTGRRAVVVRVDHSFSPTRFRARLDDESRSGSFLLVLDVDDEVEVTLEMARVWLIAVLDYQVGIERLVVASRTPRTQVLVQAIALAARYRGSSRSVEAANSLEEAGRTGRATEHACRV